MVFFEGEGFSWGLLLSVIGFVRCLVSFVNWKLLGGFRDVINGDKD